MTDRPILFSAPMVRALLVGTKTQTRRTAGLPTIEEQPNGNWHIYNRHAGAVNVAEEFIGEHAADYTTIQPGDRLWVKENGWERPDLTKRMMRSGADTWEPFYYDADLDEQDHVDLKAWGFKRRPSIHMRRIYSRITLHVTDLRVQRLQEISEADALAEGIQPYPSGMFGPPPAEDNDDAIVADNPTEAYMELWDAINGAGAWDRNPWVAAYTFAVERANIDQARAGE